MSKKSAPPPPPPAPVPIVAAVRRRLPDERKSVTKMLVIKHAADSGSSDLPVEIDIYITVGLYPDGRPGEVFLKAGHMGTTISGLLDALAMCLSIGLQSGIPIGWYIDKLKGTKFEPAGPTSDDAIRFATSILDGVARWLERRFLEPTT